jgi:Rieske Fe-S protein
MRRSAGERLEGESARPCTRRALLGAVAASACLAPLAALAQPADPAAKLHPQPGDRLVFAAGDRAGRVVAAPDVVAGAEPIAAWPMDAASRVVRDGTRLNQVRILRLEFAALTSRTAENAAEGIVAYASMCSHAGCDVTGWDAGAHELICPCHGSTYDALDAGAIVKGPATRPLAMLPLRIENGELRVARGFTRKVGFTPA